MFETPVLFLIFNRKDTTQQVFDAIKRQKPRYLYVAADGPREHKTGEVEKCRQTRDIINQIDWDCELRTLYRDENLGCRVAVSSAINWFFEQVEYGIILEDDCLPNPSFFPFCEELLIKYKDDERVGHIGGDCFLPDVVDRSLSYDFCSISHIWGWATWRRVWDHCDMNFTFWKENKNDQQKLENLFLYVWEKTYFSSFLTDALDNRNGMSVWDVQYFYSLRLQSQLSIYPSINLVTNIGLNSADATHTTRENKKLYIASEEMKFPLIHPAYFIRNKQIEKKSISIFFSWKRLYRYIFHSY